VSLSARPQRPARLARGRLAAAGVVTAALMAFGPPTGVAAAGGRPPGTNPFGPLTRQPGNCFTFDSQASALPTKPDGWYDLAISGPAQPLFTALPRSAFVRFTPGLEVARNDAASVDGFIGHTDRGPQTFCVDPAVTTSVYYQVLFDTTGTAPKPPGNGWAGGVTLYQHYGWSNDF